MWLAGSGLGLWPELRERPEWSREVARDVLGVEPLEIAGAHFPMFDRPAGLADLLERVLEPSA